MIRCKATSGEAQQWPAGDSRATFQIFQPLNTFTVVGSAASLASDWPGRFPLASGGCRLTTQNASIPTLFYSASPSSAVCHLFPFFAALCFHFNSSTYFDTDRTISSVHIASIRCE